MKPSFNLDTAKLLLARRQKHEADWWCPQHTHPFWEFIYYEQGSGRIETTDGAYKPNQFYVSIYPPGLPHFEMTEPSDPQVIVGLWIQVDGSFPDEAPILIPDCDGDMRWQFGRIADEYLKMSSDRLLDSYLRVLLCLVERELSAKPMHHDAVDLAVQYIQGSYSEDITVDTLAHLVHLSPVHFTNLFTNRMGISPMRYLRQTRLEIGKRLLLTTRQSIAEIAEQIGFEDPSYFGRTLRQATGYSPTEFREQVEYAQKVGTAIDFSVPISITRPLD